MIRTMMRDDGFRVMTRSWKDIFSVWWSTGFSFWIELPSEWHEETHGTIHICLGWPSIFIHFPWYRVYEDHGQCEGPKVGFTYFEKAFHVYHGNSTGRPGDRSMTFIHMPWSLEHVRHQVMAEIGLVTPAPREYRPPYTDGRIVEVYDYAYKLKSGEVQNRKATIYIEEREWRWYWFQWSLWPNKIRRCISVNFNDEVGERTGSWKGGCVGCGYDLLPGETALQCLRRMEAERDF